MAALTLIAGCAIANPSGRPALHVDATHPQWMAQLSDERFGDATLRRLRDQVRPTQSSALSGYDIAETFVLETAEGLGMAVGLRRSYGLCARGVRYHPGGITAPDFAGHTHDAIVLLDAQGRPTYSGSNGYFGPPLVLVDANGDGKAEELVHHSRDFVGDDKPFVTIMNVAGGELSFAFALQFNANASVSVRSLGERLYEGEWVTVDDGVKWRPRETFDFDAIRYGGWSFAPSPSGYNDIVVFETIDGISRKVAHFPYSAEERRWLYPDELPEDALWSVPTSVRLPLGRSTSTSRWFTRPDDAVLAANEAPRR